MARANQWIKRGLLAVGLAVVAAGAAGAVVYHRVHGTPDWYEPDPATEAQQRTAAGEAEAKLVRFYDWVVGRKAAEDRLRATVTDPSAANARSAAAARALLDAPKDRTQQIEFTDAQLNGIFATWAGYKDRRAMLEAYVENPRLVIRDGQLIVVGKAKQMDLVVSMIFAPDVTPDGKIDLRLAHVMGGMLPLPAAVYDPKLQAVRQVLLSRLPEYQARAKLDGDNLANAAAASAAMNELLVGALASRPTPAVVFVPVRPPGLAPTMPVRITAVTARDHKLTLTAEPMTVADRRGLIEQIKAADAGGADGDGAAAKP